MIKKVYVILYNTWRDNTQKYRFVIVSYKEVYDIFSIRTKNIIWSSVQSINVQALPVCFGNGEVTT